MEFSVKSGAPEKQRSACIIVGVYTTRKLTPTAEHLDKISKGHISKLVRRGDIDGEIGQYLMAYDVPNMLADRVMLVGCGREKDLTVGKFRKIIATAITTINDSGAMDATCYLSELSLKGLENYQKIRHIVEASQHSVYRFDQLKSKAKPPRKPLKRLVLGIHTRSGLAACERAVTHGQAIANGVELTKNLGNMPANHCTPTYLANQAKQLAKQFSSVSSDILDEADMKKLKMGALLAVAQGSKEPAKLITMHYKGGKKTDKPIALVGKGITFDSGGISLKPGNAMDEMKYDMCGAATVFGTLKAVAEMKLPINVVGLVAATENMPGGRAYKPGDVITSMSGQTIEVLNTDAEGRLVLCDALTYAEKFNPSVVIDIATLTGSMVAALGHHTTGIFSNHDPLANDLLQASKQAADAAWRMPLNDDYQRQIDSPFADMANIGGFAAGSITAACFLARYTEKYRWAHLDIAGTAWQSSPTKGGSGRPVYLLSQYLLNKCRK